MQHMPGKGTHDQNQGHSLGPQYEVWLRAIHTRHAHSRLCKWTRFLQFFSSPGCQSGSPRNQLWWAMRSSTTKSWQNTNLWQHLLNLIWSLFKLRWNQISQNYCKSDEQRPGIIVRAASHTILFILISSGQLLCKLKNRFNGLSWCFIWISVIKKVEAEEHDTVGKVVGCGAAYGSCRNWWSLCRHGPTGLQTSQARSVASVPEATSWAAAQDGRLKQQWHWTWEISHGYSIIIFSDSDHWSQNSFMMWYLPVLSFSTVPWTPGPIVVRKILGYMLMPRVKHPPFKPKRSPRFTTCIVHQRMSWTLNFFNRTKGP